MFWKIRFEIYLKLLIGFLKFDGVVMLYLLILRSLEEVVVKFCVVGYEVIEFVFYEY